ncbi:IS110 family transposase [Corynebacterium ulcerans]|uniref:IS110 family transposase n=1 Tax=Corynebacterium ulcerans TaxID=65058 RepID=UPI000CB3334C|nr:transposase [Corynebacterium ulcerans]PLW03718.1 hypothetical protein BRL54_00615 [Corynebacterium ulcerans]
MFAYSRREGNKLFDKPLPQLEPDLARLFDQLQQSGEVLVVVDQPNTIGTLPVTVARNHDRHVGYLPGLAIRKELTYIPDVPKTDKRDFHHYSPLFAAMSRHASTTNENVLEGVNNTMPPSSAWRDVAAMCHLCHAERQGVLPRNHTMPNRCLRPQHWPASETHRPIEYAGEAPRISLTQGIGKA